MVFHWSLSDSKSPQISRTLLSILAVLNNAVVMMVFTRPPTSKSSRLFNNPLVTVPKAPITIGIIVTFMFHSFFNSLARSRYLSFFSHSFSFILWSAGTAKSTILQILFFFFLLLRVFHTSFHWWFFFVVCVTECLLRSPVLLVDFNSAEAWLVSIHPLISSSLSLFSKFWWRVPRAPTMIGITVNFMFHCFYQLSGKILLFVQLFAFFHFHSLVCWLCKINFTDSLFLIN